MMAELTIQHVSKPIIAPSTWYELSYEHNITPIARTTPMPCDLLDDVDLLTARLVASDGSTYNSNRLYTEWVDGSATFSIDDPSDAHSIWRLKCGDLAYMYAAGGLLSPSSYRNYEFVRVNELKASGNWNRFLLYDLSSGKYVPVASALNLSDGASRCSIYYDVTLRNPTTGDIVNATGTSDQYTVDNSPRTTTMCLYQPFSTFAANGEMKGQITMTETPAN
jgi:hypothetical protein